MRKILMNIISPLELDYGHLHDDNFIVEKDGLDLVFKVTVDIEYHIYRPDYMSELQYEPRHSYFSVIFKEAWKDEFPVNVPSKQQTKLENELEKELRKLYLE